MSFPNDEQWKVVRALLRTALLANEIPCELVAMRPKAVWQKYKDVNHPNIQVIDYANKHTHDKFSQMLLALWKKHKNGDLEHEDKPKVIMWAKSAAKQYLRKCFQAGTIAINYEDPKQVWKDHCENHAAFARMKYDDAFVQRLGSVQDDHTKKVERCDKDLEAYHIAKKNHPTPELNSHGEPQWHGSKAQELLKELVVTGKHVDKDPSLIWETKTEFQVYSLQMFCDPSL
jgi:hypothetical protein